ncbi:MAG: hypothetical protein H7335_03445 [Massilia sp.]|nr:hypothetical protein [Massilia sp.]
MLLTNLDLLRYPDVDVDLNVDLEPEPGVAGASRVNLAIQARRLPVESSESMAPRSTLHCAVRAGTNREAPCG